MVTGFARCIFGASCNNYEIIDCPAVAMAKLGGGCLINIIDRYSASLLDSVGGVWLFFSPLQVNGHLCGSRKYVTSSVKLLIIC